MTMIREQVLVFCILFKSLGDMFNVVRQLYWILKSGLVNIFCFVLPHLGMNASFYVILN